MILFLSHYAGRTGAPMVLLSLLQWLKENTSLTFETIHLQDGNLLTEFQKIGPTTICTSTRFERNLKRFFDLFGVKTDVLNHCWQKIEEKYAGKVGMIYSNTITNGEALARLSGLNCPVICHVHEQELLIQQFGLKNMELVKRFTTHYVAASEKVKRNLVMHHQIPEDKIDTIYSFINVSTLPKKFRNIKSELNIPEQDFVVCGSGHGSIWYKGKDLFVQLAHAVNKKFDVSPVHFIWVGGSDEEMDANKIQHDVRLAGIEKYVHFIDDTDKPYDYFNICDIFVLTSREDSFPLVCLEAAALGKPVLCFEGAGGMPEFVEKDAGYIIPYLDIHVMADKLIGLLQKPDKKTEMGLRAAQKVRERHDVSVACPLLLKVIKRFL